MVMGLDEPVPIGTRFDYIMDLDVEVPILVKQPSVCVRVATREEYFEYRRSIGRPERPTHISPERFARAHFYWFSTD